MSRTTFEKLGIPSEERDGSFYPVLVAGTEKADIEAGKYGRMWIKYIKEEYPMRYKSLVRFGELEERADEVNDTAYELLDDIEAKWLKKHKPKNPNSFTEQLQLRTQTRMMAEENHEGDYHAKEYEVRAMIRDQSAEGNDSTILEGYSMDDIDADTLERYRIMFNSWNPQHVWRELPDKEFLEMLGGYRRDRREKVEGLTVAGLLMFGSGLAIRDEFDNIFMDYRNETDADDETRWVDRITYDGTWENNLFNFFRKVTPKLTEDLKKPFVLKDMQRIEDTQVHKAIREAFVNMIIHADYRMDAGVLKIVKFNDGFRFSNPGSLKLPKEQIYKGGESKARNPHMQTMLRMVGFGDNAGSGFPDILKIWSDNGWEIPELMEDTILNQVTLILKYKTDEVGESIFLDAKMSEEDEKNERRLSEAEKNERRLSEALSEVMTASDYKKVEAIILYLEDNKYVTPQIAEKLTGKSAPTVRRYLKMLVETGYVRVDGSTSNIKYVI